MDILVGGAPPVIGELIASYLRLQFPDADVKLLGSARISAAPCALVLLAGSGDSGVSGIAHLVACARSAHPRASILIVSTTSHSASAADALRCGAQGFLPRLKPLSALADALRTMLAGQTCLPQFAVQSQAEAGAPGEPLARVAPQSRTRPQRLEVDLQLVGAPSAEVDSPPLCGTQPIAPPLSVELTVLSMDSASLCRRR